MRRLLTAVLAVSLVFLAAGCPGDPAGDYADGMIKTKRKADKLKVDIETKHVIDAFKASQGRLPSSLEELKAEVGELPEPPAGKEWELQGDKLVAVDVTGAGN